MSSHNIPKRNATGAFATPIDPPQLRANPRAHQQQDGNENLIDETAKMAKRLTEGPSQTQCVFGNDDIAPGTSIAGVSGRLGDPKLASMQKMVLDSVPEGSQVKIIYLITKIKEDGNNDLRAGTADNAAAAHVGPSEVDRFVQQNNAVQDRTRAQVHQHRQAPDDDITRSIPSSHAMHRATLSLDSPHFDTSFHFSVRIAQQTNASNSNSDGDEEDDEGLVRVRYNGDPFENFFTAYAAAFPSEDLPPYRRLDDVYIHRLR
ncbi:hypothetical protein CSIM01_13210 [Colletotrichum simmondsii]|uniref:Uncharacterized protein n=1 Tax=Colletotrichum simmondsii TaxID=703756 RepID=A0A135TG41_9PEZI|nr:hypothetical protein CSIM01_13210 [Colletotrichum simmondsii]